MEPPSRRALIGSVGAGIAGLLAGCAGRAPMAGHSAEQASASAVTPTPSEPPTSTDQPESTGLPDRLPAPAAVGGRYTFGAFDWGQLRAAELDRGTLRPGRFVPGALHDALPATQRSLTLNTGTAAGGTLEGEYTDGSVVAALSDAGFSRTEGRFRNDALAVAVSEGVLRWADAPDGGDAIINAVGNRLEDRGERYTETAPGLGPVLDGTSDAPARFARPLVVDSGPFERSTFLATAIQPTDAGVTWVSAVGFDGPVPDTARERFRARYADLEEVQTVESMVDDGVLVVEVNTTADLITSIQPL